MRVTEESRGKYWAIYSLTYVVCVGFLLWEHQGKQLHDTSLLADTLTIAAGLSLSVAIALEGIVAMVLWAPARIRKLKRQGRKEQRDRTREAYKRFGVDMNGVLVLPRTPEVEEFLASDEPLEEQ